MTCTFCFSVSLDGLSLVNEDGGLRVFFPRNSFVTNTTLTHTNTPRQLSGRTALGDDHIVCYGGSLQAGLDQVPWYNNGGTRQLEACLEPCIVACHSPCSDCGGRCKGNGAISVDPPLSGQTDIHMYTNVASYVNQDLECRAPNDLSAFIGVYLESGGELVPLLISDYINRATTLSVAGSVHWTCRNYVSRGSASLTIINFMVHVTSDLHC